ncbi:hypothetical protein, partial [Nonomuraea basaltis]|uniref:hypothetical protein n=1 Tax=Nonomuraea basaltis TaxID=2495887 RepID=UPI00148624F6
PPARPQQAAAPDAAQPAPRPRRRRTLLIAAGAVVVSLLATAAQSYDGYLFYERQTTKETRETIVATGQAGKVHNIEWKATVAPMKAPAGSRHGPEVTWLRVDITKKVLDKGSATMITEPGEVQLADRAGRTWTVEIEPVGDRPTDRLVVGKEYKIQGVAIVPAPVANEVELSFRPSTYRSDTPTEDLFKREGAEKLEEPVDVLRFRRR